jgi:hypothetical protein
VSVLGVAASQWAANSQYRAATDKAFRQGELDTMDTSDFDKQAHQHLSIYNGVMTASKIVIGLVILTLVVMAATLL